MTQATRSGGLTPASRSNAEEPGSVAAQHKEGPVALSIEKQTAKLPSDLFLWAAFGSIAASACCHVIGKKETANFIGHWAPTFLTLGLYNKLVKVMGSDRLHSEETSPDILAKFKHRAAAAIKTQEADMVH